MASPQANTTFIHFTLKSDQKLAIFLSKTLTSTKFYHLSLRMSFKK